MAKNKDSMHAFDATGLARMYDSMNTRPDPDLLQHIQAIGSQRRSPDERQAEIYMEGLKAQVAEIEASLKADQELVMICWQGQEKMQVMSVSMPSHNVVALRCSDSEGAIIQVTGHMNSITFSFRVVTTIAPAKRNKIGFEMPLPEAPAWRGNA